MPKVVDTTPVPEINVPKLCIKPKPHLRILSTHNLTRQFQYEQRSMALRITEQVHGVLKQVCEVWHVGLPVYLAYAVMRALAEDTGAHFKWLDSANGAPAPESEFHEVFPSTPSQSPVAQAVAPTASFDPLAAL